MSNYFTIHGTMVVIHCYKCKVAFAMSKEHDDRCHKTKEEFYCPNGHGQIYTMSTEQKLRDKLDRERRLRADAEDDAERSRKQVEIELALHNHTKYRISKGVCPCCNRSFENLRRHMETKHPDYIGNHAKRLRQFRNQQGISQQKIAYLIGISTASISKFEREHHVGEWVNDAITEWVDENL